MKTKVSGRYIVTDPKICHGQPTFRGTRILVADVLEQVASGMAWESIVSEWRGSSSEVAISEAVRAASETFRLSLKLTNCQNSNSKSDAVRSPTRPQLRLGG